jgi:hypothetical protein
MNRAGLYEVLEAYLAALGRRDAHAVPWAMDRSPPRTT